VVPWAQAITGHPSAGASPSGTNSAPVATVDSPERHWVRYSSFSARTAPGTDSSAGRVLTETSAPGTGVPGAGSAPTGTATTPGASSTVRVAAIRAMRTRADMFVPSFAGADQAAEFPAFHVDHGMFQSPRPSVPESVPPTVFRTTTMSPRLVLSKIHFAFAGLRFRHP